MDNKSYLIPNLAAPGVPLIIDSELCIGCNTCANQCRVDVFVRDPNRVFIGLVNAPCRNACPAGIDIPRYIRAVGEGKYGEAVAVIREKVPFPATLGYICGHPCETKCRRGQRLEQAIAIKELKRFAADHDTGLWKQNSMIAPPTGKKVAIVGSGPAGLTAAYYLAKLGHKVTVFESLPVAGGMLRVGAPEYRLPTAVLEAEIEEIKNAGVEIRTNSRVEALEKLLEQGYDATLLAVGTHRGTKLPIPNADLEGVLVATSFLRDVRLGRRVKIGKRVIVLGGGSVAFDCAGTCLRLGATEVHIACLEPREGMLASPEDIEQGEVEGVIIHCSHTFSRIVGDDNGRVSGVECLDVSSFNFDREGKLNVNTIKNSEHILPADTVIFAVGQVSELELIEGVSDIKTTRRRTLQVNTGSLATGKEGVFAAGDVVSGASSVVEAIAAGRRAAMSIDKYLGGEGNIDEVLASPEEEPTLFDIEEAESGKYRPPVEVLPVDERLKGHAQVVLGFIEKNTNEECTRCLRCDLKGYPPIVLYPDECWFCGTCVEDCPVPGAIKLQHPLNRRVGWLRKETGEYFRIGMKNPPTPNTRPPIG